MIAGELGHHGRLGHGRERGARNGCQLSARRLEATKCAARLGQAVGVRHRVVMGGGIYWS
jgi:hypothetical protein